jgi:CubicO group peptidase (beta-lactamase class C family)
MSVLTRASFPLVLAVVACSGGSPPAPTSTTAPASPSPAPSGGTSSDGAGAPPATGDDAGAAPVDAAGGASPLDALDGYLTTQMTALSTPGLAAAIVRGDQVLWSHGYGWANVAKQVPVTTSTLFHLASISKTVTATAVMQLVEAGSVNLDDDVSKQVGFTVRNPNFPSAPITLRMLLSHVSSILDTSQLWTLVSENKPTTITLQQFVTGYFTPKGTYYDATQGFDTKAPGTTWTYCNAAMTLAGYHVQAVSKVAFDDYLQAHVFKPLGMNESSYRLASLDASHIAMQYDSDGTTEIGNDDYPDYPDGELRTSVDQFARFLLMFMNGGTYGGATILQATTVKTMQTAQFPTINADQGLAWYYTTRGSHRILGHEGAVVGVSTAMGFDPVTNVGVAIFTNGNAVLAGQTTADAFEQMVNHVFDVAEALP